MYFPFHMFMNEMPKAYFKTVSKHCRSPSSKLKNDHFIS